MCPHVEPCLIQLSIYSLCTNSFNYYSVYKNRSDSLILLFTGEYTFPDVQPTREFRGKGFFPN